LKEAVLGARNEAPTIGHPVQLTVPKGSNAGTKLRLRERGIRPYYYARPYYYGQRYYRGY
jgi:DnaJ-class molecular chaperone